MKNVRRRGGSGGSALVYKRILVHVSVNLSTVQTLPESMYDDFKAVWDCNDIMQDHTGPQK